MDAIANGKLRNAVIRAVVAERLRYPAPMNGAMRGPIDAYVLALVEQDLRLTAAGADPCDTSGPQPLSAPGETTA